LILDVVHVASGAGLAAYAAVAHVNATIDEAKSPVKTSRVLLRIVCFIAVIQLTD
jgi:hypothetical protein